MKHGVLRRYTYVMSWEAGGRNIDGWAAWLPAFPAVEGCKPFLNVLQASLLGLHPSEGSGVSK